MVQAELWLLIDDLRQLNINPSRLQMQKLLCYLNRLLMVSNRGEL